MTMLNTIHFNGYNFKIPQSSLHYGGSFDFQKAFGNINLPWYGKKYSGEKHVFGHSYTGIGTRLDLRLDKNDKPKPGEEPKNRVDKAAYHHDIKYRNAGNDLPLKHQADREMIQELKNIQNPSLGEKFQRALVIKALQSKLKLGFGLPRKAKQDAIDLLKVKPKQNKSKIHADEIHKQFRKPKQLRKMNFRSKDNIWCADLVIMPPENDYKYILTILDGYTKYAWCIPLKHKDGLSVSNAFKDVIKKI